MRPVAALELANEISLDWGEGGEGGEGGCSADDAVVVYTGPDEHRFVEAEENEGEYGEAERELSSYPAEDVVVPLVGGWLGAVGGEEEGAHVSAEIYGVLAVKLK